MLSHVHMRDENGANALDIKKYDGYIKIILKKSKFFLNIDIW